MATLLENRITRLRSRKSDPQKNLTKVRNQNLAKSMGKFDSSQDAKDYISESMDAVESEYTKKTFDESERIQNQIKEACETQGLSISFRNQGSVTNDTHIKFFSDIDLLVITEQFITLKSPLQVTSPYQGDPLQDLKNLRNLIERRLESSFRQAKVDKQGPKAVRISGGSLSREVDVIPANWYDTQEYRNTSSEVDRGIQILDLSGPSRIANFPFLHNKEINQKDILTNGALRKSIRFVKSAKYDSNDDKTINVSSYDITSLCYHFPTDKL